MGRRYAGPMSEISDRYSTIAEGFETRLRGVGGDQWASPTPCDDWDVRSLVAHVVSTHRRVLANLGGQADDVGPDADLLAAFVAERRAVDAAIRDPETASRVVSGMTGEQPFESLVGRLLAADTLVHTWDLARATHQDEHLDPAAVAACAAFLAPIDEVIRRPGGFAAKIEPAAGTDDQTRLLNFCGRTV